MAIDWTKVEGYREDMTPEEKLALIEGMDAEPPHSTGGTNWKAQFDKTASELSAVKKQLKAKMTEDEQREAERTAAENALKEELDELRRERTVNNLQRAFAEQHYDTESASAMAKALAEGDTDGMFKALRKANDEMVKSIKADLLRDTPRPGTGGNPEVKDSDSVALAKQIGGQRAAADKTANDIVNHYK